MNNTSLFCFFSTRCPKAQTLWKRWAFCKTKKTFSSFFYKFLKIFTRSAEFYQTQTYFTTTAEARKPKVTTLPPFISFFEQRKTWTMLYAQTKLTQSARVPLLCTSFFTLTRFPTSSWFNTHWKTCIFNVYIFILNCFILSVNY